MDENRELLRHILATLAYRTVRTLDDAPIDFAAYAGAGRQPLQILSHMGDLMVWALSMARGNPEWHGSQPLPWPQEQQRFFDALAAFDSFLASRAPIHAPLERLLQGPVADALTHAGQLAMLRRLAGSPTCGEDFYLAGISVGQVGPVQPVPVRTF